MTLPPFEEIWREHKRFLIAVGAGLIAFFGGLSIVSSVEDGARKVARQNRETENEIRSIGDEIAGREGLESGVGGALEKTVSPEIRAAVEFHPRPAYVPTQGKDQMIVYAEAIEQVEKMRAEALRRNIATPDDFGLGAKEDKPAEERVRVLIAGADLVERVLTALVAVNVRSIETVKPGEPDYVKIVPGGDMGDPPHDWGEKEPIETAPYLRRLPLRVVAQASFDALETFLAGFQRAGSTLELAGMRLTRAEDGIVRFDLELMALTLVQPAEAKAAKASGGPGGARPRTGGPRPGGRLR